MQVSGFTSGVGAQSLSALRLNGCYERLPDDCHNGFPHFQNEYGHMFYYAAPSGADICPQNMWGFDLSYDYQSAAAQEDKNKGPYSAWILATPDGRPENPQPLGPGTEQVTSSGGGSAMLYPFVAHAGGDGEAVDLNLVLTLLRGDSATTAVQEARTAATTAAVAVQAQLRGMDVLVSGCPDQLCNGRYSWQGLRKTNGVSYPYFKNEHNHHLYRNERGCDWRINDTLPDRDDCWATKFFIDSEQLLPVGAQTWVREAKNVEQMLKDASVAFVDIVAAQSKHTLNVKLRRRRY